MNILRILTSQINELLQDDVSTMCAPSYLTDLELVENYKSLGYKIQNKVQRFIKFHKCDPDEEQNNRIVEKALKEVVHTMSQENATIFMNYLKAML